MREQLIIGPIFVMLRFVMIFVGLGSKRELEQLRVLGALAFHIGTFMLLAPDVDTKKTLHSRNHAAYRSLHRLKTVFHSVFVLKWCLSIHDDMQGANKVRTRCAVSRRAGLAGRSRRAGSTGQSRRAGSTGRSLNYQEEQDQQGDR
jgi:hypothetical protein